MSIIKKKSDKRKLKKREKKETLSQAFLDILIFIPELLLLPFRFLWFLIKILLKALFD